MEYIQIRNTIVKSYWLYIKPFAELLRQKRVKLLFIIRMFLIITTSAIINKLMTKPNMFPPKIICNDKTIITRSIVSCNKYSIDLLYFFMKFTIPTNYTHICLCTNIGYTKIPRRSEGFIYYKIPNSHIPNVPAQKWIIKLTTEIARPTRHHVPWGT